MKSYSKPRLPQVDMRRALRARQEDGQTDLVFVAGPVALGIVHGCDVDLTRPEFRIRDGLCRITAAANGHHDAVLAVLDAAHGHARESRSDHLIDEIGTS